MAGNRLSKWEINKHDKEKRLLEAAKELFLEKGIQNTTVSDIVKAAGVAKGTFYLYYKDKTAVEETLIAREATSILKDAIDVAYASGEKTFRKHFLIGVDYIIDYLIENPEIVHFIKKNLSYALYTLQGDDNESAKNLYLKLYQSFTENVGPIQIENGSIMIGLMIEFLGASIYSSLVYNMPKPMNELRPHLHRVINTIFDQYGAL